MKAPLFTKDSPWFAIRLQCSQPIQPTVRTDSLYRDVTTTDTATIANIPWTRMFKSSTLQTLLQEGVANNYDLKIAVARIKQAEANLRQSRAAFLPTISGGPQVTQQKISASQGGAIFNKNREKLTCEDWFNVLDEDLNPFVVSAVMSLEAMKKTKVRHAGAHHRQQPV